MHKCKSCDSKNIVLSKNKLFCKCLGCGKFDFASCPLCKNTNLFYSDGAIYCKKCKTFSSLTDYLADDKYADFIDKYYNAKSMSDNTMKIAIKVILIILGFVSLYFSIKGKKTISEGVNTLFIAKTIESKKVLNMLYYCVLLLSVFTQVKNFKHLFSKKLKN